VNFLTAPAGTAGSVGSTLAYFSKATPLDWASVGGEVVLELVLVL